MDLVYIHGLMAVNLKEIGNLIRLQDMEYTTGKMEEFIMATGRKIICMDKDIINGQMEGNMKEDI